jgi:pilus assembly protein CpaE
MSSVDSSPAAAPGDAAAVSGRGRTIVFAHASGGAGATTLAVNTALHLARKPGSGKVCLLDLDFQFGTVDLHFNLPASSQIADLAVQPERLDDQLFEDMLVDGPEGIRVLTSPASVLPLDIFGVKLIESLLDIAGRHYGTVVIDLPVALAGWVGPVFEHADQVFLVTQVNVIALRTARALLDALDIEGLGRNHIAVVASRYPASGYGARITLDRAREVLGVPVRGRIPSDYPSIVESLDYGVPAAISAPHSRYTRAVASLLDSLERDESAGKSGRGLFRLWRK